MISIGFIRHGITDWNAQGRLQGHSDIPLNAEGQAQASALAEALPKGQWHRLISSDLSRARDTAAAIAQTLNIPLSTDPRLRERAYGLFEGTTKVERMERWGDDWRTKFETEKEPDEQLVARAAQCFHELLDKYPNENLLLVSHGGTLRALLGNILNQSDFPSLDNTSLTIIEQVRAEDQTKDDHEFQWQLSKYNDISHKQNL